MSLRTSASLPARSSGAMYRIVPTIFPSSVSCCAVASTGDDSTRCFARPKSSSFTPDFVSITFDGFKSRWMIPCRWAFSNASAISIPYRSTARVEVDPRRSAGPAFSLRNAP